MIKILINYSSKNKKSLNKFQKFLKKFIKSKKIKIKFNKNVFKKIVILKSPHIHKVAQELFSFGFFTNKLKVYNYNLTYLLNLIKKTWLISFFDVKLNQTFYIFKNKRFYFSVKNYFVNFDNELFIKYFYKNRTKTNNLLNIFKIKGFYKINYSLLNIKIK